MRPERLDIACMACGSSIPPARASSISIRTSATSCKRSRGFLARHLRSNRRTDCGTVAGNASGSGSVLGSGSGVAPAIGAGSVALSLLLLLPEHATSIENSTQIRIVWTQPVQSLLEYEFKTSLRSVAKCCAVGSLGVQPRAHSFRTPAV